MLSAKCLPFCSGLNMLYPTLVTFLTPVAAFTNILIPAWISNYTHYNVWDEITNPFLNFNGAIVEV